MLKNDNYVLIHGWMVNKLGLSGNDLLIYAIIFGFSQDGDGCFSGKRQYLADWCGSSERAVSRNLKNLLDKGLIEQIYKSIDCHDVRYRVTDTRDIMSGEPVTKCQGASDKMSGGLVSNCQGAHDKMSGVYIDNKIDKLEDNKIDKIVVDQSTPAPFKIPTIEAVKTFAERHGKAVVDPVTFYEYYQANGWKVGKNKMKDWRAAFRMWESREKGARPSGSGTKKPEDVPYMQKEYTKEHLEQKEADSMRVLDDLLGEG